MEERYFTGARKDPLDKRDLVFDKMALGSPKVDWKKGFDIRNILGVDIDIKNQGRSSSCVGQGWSYYVWVLQALEMMKIHGCTIDQLKKLRPKEVEAISAKAIYSQIALSSGGAYIRSGCKLIADWGSVFESVVPSYQNGRTPTEAFIKDKKWRTKAISELAKILKGKEYRSLKGSNNMNLFALAIEQNKGVVGGVIGSNGRGWGAERPKPPQKGDKTWGHCIFYGAYGQDDFGKFIATPNSWGVKVKDKWKKGAKPGTGWQKLYADYFNGKHQFNPWTYTDLPNKKVAPKPKPIPKPKPMTHKYLRLVKTKGTEAVYAIGKDGRRYWIMNPYSLNKGKEMGLWGDWTDVKEIPATLVKKFPKGTPISFLN